ncbi:hypothetical protein F2Q70_00031187 [Brassica cretica]|uniref:Uncharacterized protein n=1 Tax=Brassica cretica TaxID=69181 RepID=A0A8S9FDR6_BRACR|nr:hypothetical protein F2Q70_00031187 [Brassica cretica]
MANPHKPALICREFALMAEKLFDDLKKAVFLLKTESLPSFCSSAQPFISTQSPHGSTVPTLQSPPSSTSPARSSLSYPRRRA